MPYYTPLRYPGGKRRLAAFVMRLLEENEMCDVQYVEPFAGGASVALALLFEEYASTIHLNDLSRPVFAFWHSVLNETSELCRRIERTEVTMDEWHRQRAVYGRREEAGLLDLGFATFFLNRTNRSGIIAGGVIGGKQQAGAWKLDARFTKPELTQRIRRIARYGSRIRLYQRDALDFTNQVIPHLGPNTFVFFDPPYIEKGKGLYLNDYDINDHRRLAVRVIQLEQPWVVTYDYEAAIRHQLYRPQLRLVYELPYVAQSRYGGKEVVFLSKRLTSPESWRPSVTFSMSGSARAYPLYGMVESMKKPHPNMEEGPQSTRK